MQHNYPCNHRSFFFHIWCLQHVWRDRRHPGSAGQRCHLYQRRSSRVSATETLTVITADKVIINPINPQTRLTSCTVLQHQVRLKHKCLIRSEPCFICTMAWNRRQCSLLIRTVTLFCFPASTWSQRRRNRGQMECEGKRGTTGFS